MADKSDWSPLNTGPLYDLHAPRWMLELDMSEMTWDVLRSGKYLDRFSADEAEEDYAYRRSMSAAMDMCRDGVQIRIDNIWRVPPVRTFKGSKFEAIFDKLVNDADTQGTSLDDFMRGANWDYYVNGVDIVTQLTTSEANILTVADQREQDIRAYFIRFMPLRRFDWASNGAGNLEWARYSLGMRPRATEQDCPTNEFLFLTLNSETWTIWVVTTDGKSETGRTSKTGDHNLGIPPITKFYYGQSRKEGQGAVPLSLLTRPAVVAKAMLNMKGQADADLIAAVTRWAITGLGPEDGTPDRFGPGVVWRIPDKDAKLVVAQGDVDHIKEKREWVKLYGGEILRLLKFRGGMAEINASSGSGVKLQIERTDFENELHATTEQLEAIEVEMMRQAVSMQTGTVIAKDNASEELGYSVQYNKDYVLEGVEELLANAKAWFCDCGLMVDDVPEIGRSLLKDIANVLMQEGSAEHTQAFAEIAATRFDGQAVLNTESDG